MIRTVWSVPWWLAIPYYLFAAATYVAVLAVVGTAWLCLMLLRMFLPEPSGRHKA